MEQGNKTASIALLNYKVGDEDDKGNMIRRFFVRNEHHVIYETLSGDVTMMMQDPIGYDWASISMYTSKISYLLSSSPKLKAHFASNIAKAYNDFFIGNASSAIELFKEIESGIVRRKKVSIKLTYLVSCLIFVSINAIIGGIIGILDLNITEPETTIYIYAIIFGSFGGFLSISLNINKLELDFDGSRTLHMLTGVTRIMIAMVSSVVVLVMIKSNIILGTINEAHNQFALYSFSVLAGFSESFIPNILKKVEDKHTNKESSSEQKKVCATCPFIEKIPQANQDTKTEDNE